MELQIRSARGFTLELSQSNISSVFEKNSELVSKKLAEYKDRRDELNVKVRNQLDKRSPALSRTSVNRQLLDQAHKSRSCLRR